MKGMSSLRVPHLNYAGLTLLKFCLQVAADGHIKLMVVYLFVILVFNIPKTQK